MSTHERIWVGIDVGKAHHWAVVVDQEGRRLLSRKVANDEDTILDLVRAAGELAGEVRWAVDISSRLSALLLALLVGAGQQVLADDEQAQIIQSLPGMGPLLTAEFIAVTGGLSGYRDAGHLAAHAGIAPVPSDLGAAPATCTGPPPTTDGYAASSTSPPRQRCAGPAPRGTTTARSAPRGSSTARRSCAWPAAGSTYCGRCCATSAPIKKPRR